MIPVESSLPRSRSITTRLLDTSRSAPSPVTERDLVCKKDSRRPSESSRTRPTLATRSGVRRPDSSGASYADESTDNSGRLVDHDYDPRLRGMAHLPHPSVSLGLRVVLPARTATRAVEAVEMEQVGAVGSLVVVNVVLWTAALSTTTKGRELLCRFKTAIEDGFGPRETAPSRPNPLRGHGGGRGFGRCTGSSLCHVCSTCSSCAYCRYGGTCGACLR